MAPKRRESRYRDSQSAKTGDAVSTSSTNGAGVQSNGHANGSMVSNGEATGPEFSLNAVVGEQPASGMALLQQQQRVKQIVNPSDMEMFLATYEKPTQIYRYLRTRNQLSPLFMQRNLNYMSGRSRRHNRGRPLFKVNDMLAVRQQQIHRLKSGITGDYMTIMFLGLHDKSLRHKAVCVEVETFLTYRKHKDSSRALQERFGISTISANSEDSSSGDECLDKIPAVSIPADYFNAALNGTGDGGGDHYSSVFTDVRKFVLQLTVNVMPHDGRDRNGQPFAVFDDDDEEDDDSDAERRRQPHSKRARSAIHVTYESELMVFDEQQRCLLTDGEYDLMLNERPVNGRNGLFSQPDKRAAWDSLSDGLCIDLAAEPLLKPILKFRLAWTRDAYTKLVDRPLPITVIRKQPQAGKVHAHATADTPMTATTLLDTNHNNNDVAVSSSVGIDYHFMYHNNTRQQTESSVHYFCPWCCMNCLALYSLLKHMKMCHARFSFTMLAQATGSSRARIEVCVNELFDCSYSGSPNDLVGPAVIGFSRAGPVQRTAVTRILVCRPRRTKPSLNEFLEQDDNEQTGQRPYISGHNRLYHHTMTCLPVHPKELDVDSEGENDPAWLQHKTKMMIDDFTDVNEGEKELMKMWNLHIMRNGYVGDIQIGLACEMFIDIHGAELLEKNLYKNFIMHLCNLSDYGLLSAEPHFKLVQRIQRLLASDDVGRRKFATSRNKQLEHWQSVGHAKYEQKLLLDARLPALSVQAAVSTTNVGSSRPTSVRLSATSEKAASSSSASSFALPASSNAPTLPSAKRESKVRESKPNKSNNAGAAAVAVPVPIGNKRRFSLLRG